MHKIEKSRFEISSTLASTACMCISRMHVWCFVYAILHQSIYLYKIIQLMFSIMDCKLNCLQFYKPGINGRLTYLRKQTGELVATIYLYMHT